MSYELSKLEYVILKSCYHCHGTGIEPDQGQGGDPANGTQTCSVCEGLFENKIVEAEIWSVD